MVSGYFITTNTNDHPHSNANAIQETSNGGAGTVKDIDVPTKVAMDRIENKAMWYVDNITDNVVAVKRIVCRTGA